jgi:hypothetical protein
VSEHIERLVMLIKGEEPAHNLDEETEGLMETKIEEVVDGDDDDDEDNRIEEI